MMKLKMWRSLFITTCLVLLASIGTALCSPLPSVQEIVEQTEQAAYYQGDDGSARVEMTITDGQGRERKRRLTILRRDRQGSPDQAQTGEQKYYVHIEHPADLRNTVLTIWKHGQKDDDRWLYLPALDLLRRIAASDKRTSFLGSNFFYEDISGRSTELDLHEISEVSDNYFVVNNTPKYPDSVEFSHYMMWIHRQTFLPVTVEFYDKQGDKYRIYQALEVETIQGHPTVIKASMQDLRSKGQTLLEFSHVQYDLGIAEDIFTERYLRNPPTKYLR